MNDPQFTESQQFRQKGLWFVYVLLWAALLLFLYATFRQVILQKPFGDKPAPDLVLIPTTFILILVLVGLYIARLDTIITRETISYRWAPFKRKFTVVRWEDVSQADVFDLGFAGAGYRFTEYGTLHNVWGTRKGLRLKMHSGKTLILGTQKPEELEKILKQR